MVFTREEVYIKKNQGVEEATTKIQHIRRDPRERGSRLLYQVVEIFIYFGWSILVVAILRLAGVRLSLAVIIGVVMFLWPYLKGLYGNLRAKPLKKDPRLMIRSLFWLDGFMFVGSPFLREIRQYSALARSLDVIYNFFGRFGVMPSKFPDDSWVKVSPLGFLNKTIKWWTDFWGGMPIAQDVRTRLDIVAEEYRQGITELAKIVPGRTISILEVAGGQLQEVIMGLRRALDDGINFQYYVTSIEPDGEFARSRALELIRKFGLVESCFRFIPSRISIRDPKRAVSQILKKEGFQAERFDFVACIGLGDYYYSWERIVGLLKNLDLGHKIIVANIANNFVERGFLHIFVQWPRMKYRPLAEWIKILRAVWPKENIKVIQTPHKIFNIAVVG